ECVERTLAVVAFARSFPPLGDRRNSGATGILRQRGGAGIRRPVHRNYSQAAATLLLSSSPSSQICAVEWIVNWVWYFFLETARSNYAPRNALARLLEHRRAGRHVGYPVETGRPHFSGGAAAVLIVRRTSRCARRNRALAGEDTSMAGGCGAF